MPDTGAPWSLPYPLLSDEADAPKYVQLLAEQVDAGLDLINSGGAALPGGRPYVDVAANAVQSMASSQETVLNFHIAGSNPDGMWTSGPNITIPAGKGGLYLIILGFSWAGNATGARILLGKVNGTSFGSWNLAGAGASPSFSGKMPLLRGFSAGDVITMAQYQSSGAPLNTFGQAYPSFQAVRLGL